jgi:hypothetical protein
MATHLKGYMEDGPGEVLAIEGAFECQSEGVEFCS